MVERRMLKQKPRPPMGNIGAKRPSKEEAVRTVTVACKLPNGLILQLWDMVNVFEAGPGGGRSVPQARPRENARYVVRGNRLPHGVIPDFQMTANNNGYALTPDIPEDFWNEWLEQNKGASYVVNKLVFACRKMADVRAIADENQGRKSGLEPIDPANVPMRQVATDEKTAETLKIKAQEPASIRRGIPQEVE